MNKRLITGRIFIFMFLLATVVFTEQSSWAKPRFSLLGGGVLSKPASSNGSTSYSAKFGPGGGLSVEFPFSAKLGLELGALYLDRKFSANAGSVKTAISLPMVQVPLLLRFWFNRFISIAAGGYAASGMGKANIGGVSETFGAANIKSRDFGVMGGLRLNFPLSHVTSFFVDGRYSRGLVNVSSASGQTIKFSDIQALAGFTFGMMGGAK